MNHINLFIDKMKAEGINEQTINTFSQYYKQFIDGEKGKLSKNQITAVPQQKIIDYDALADADTSNLNKLAIVKLNGGLGTSMGLSKAKSLLPVKDGDTFLDIIAKQTIKLRETLNINLPLIFMNSFNTSADTLEFLRKYPDLPAGELPLDFVQNKFPKVRKDDHKPLSEGNPSNHWNPPGHGDLYNSLLSTGLLDKLLSLGYEYIFVSNSDNLGAVVDAKILNKLLADNIDFAMEVCIRTEMDKKGGHLACTNDGNLVLREVAQCPDDEIDEFQNIQQYQYFNTNNLWINLVALKTQMAKHNGFLPLNLILNEKKVPPPTPPQQAGGGEISVYQFETAMGAAISVFENSKAVCVPRKRFLPVKKNQDLLLLWSDGYCLNDDFVLVKKDGACETILDLDNEHYGQIDQLLKACEKGVPSLFNCDSLKIKGFVAFDKDMIFTGDVVIDN